MHINANRGDKRESLEVSYSIHWASSFFQLHPGFATCPQLSHHISVYTIDVNTKLIYKCHVLIVNLITYCIMLLMIYVHTNFVNTKRSKINWWWDIIYKQFFFCWENHLYLMKIENLIYWFYETYKIFIFNSISIWIPNFIYF